MINGLGVLGWGVGGIEAEACMLGQPISMLLPAVVGFKLHGKLPEGCTATDLVLTVTQMLRKKGVDGKFVEFYGAGLSALSVADRATIANMAPEYGATIGFFPVDAGTLAYLRMSNRDAKLIDLVEAYSKEQSMFRTDDTKDPIFSDTLDLDLASVVPSMAGPKRPQDRLTLAAGQEEFPRFISRTRSTKEIAHRDRRSECRHRERSGGDCGHHKLHEHIKSVGDDGRGTAREEGCRERPEEQALGENEPCTRIESGHRVSG